MEEQIMMEKLIELDTRAKEINEKRKVHIAELARRYQEEERGIIFGYKQQIEDETRKTARRILQEARQEVDELKRNNLKILENMEQEFHKSLAGITDEIVKRIFRTNSKRHG